MKTVFYTTITLFNPRMLENTLLRIWFSISFLRTEACPETDPLNNSRPYTPSLLPLSNSQANHVFIR